MQTELETTEIHHNFLAFCSLVCILQGKKINLPNIFISVLMNDMYKKVLKDLLCIDNDYELFGYFINFDPSLSKSKYISKFLNSKEAKKRNIGIGKQEDKIKFKNKARISARKC